MGLAGCASVRAKVCQGMWSMCESSGHLDGGAQLAEALCALPGVGHHAPVVSVFDGLQQEQQISATSEN